MKIGSVLYLPDGGRHDNGEGKALPLLEVSMSCEICGRTSCCPSFHSIDDQLEFDEVADKVKDRMKNRLTSDIMDLDGHYHGGNYYVRLEDVLKKLQDYS